MIVGTPQVATGIYVEIADGYSGMLTLENVDFSGVKRRPCIRLGENTNVILNLGGENVLNRRGIFVPESAVLTMDGDGTLLQNDEIVYPQTT